ncbi:MAG: TonB-dependent receptor, partial [Leptolyngbya sp. SIO3F4]|nr:TonB-dependent receptor [Leptolyngbya sp. SIO3F4]
MQTGSRFALLLTFFFHCFYSFSQSSDTYTLQVQVSDDREAPLPGSYVMLPDQNRVATTDRSGMAQLSLPAGTYTVVTSFIGFATDTTEVNLQGNQTIAISMRPQPLSMEEAVVSATRASRVTPIPHQEFSAEDLDKLNEGVDLPILLDQATSVVTTSDAGAGVGYTGIRIRGSDPTRINVTVNGIPLNDAESQGVFWVNMPDFASSVSSIQIQRGVGTSTNGAGAFGATVNLNTIETQEEAYGIYSGSVGSFNTFKNTVEFGSGLINESFTIDGRLSRITSDGFIDRASSELQSYYLSAGYVHKKTFLKFITFRGHERTYQAWYGVPQSRIDAGERTYNPYDYPDQVDDYGQTHYQLHLTQELTPELRITAAGHYTQGAGFFEEYKGDRFNQGIFNDR